MLLIGRTLAASFGIHEVCQHRCAGASRVADKDRIENGLVKRKRYRVANFFGGMLTRKIDAKKVVIWTFAIWSAATVYVGFTHSLTVLLACRLILGLAEGVYWPQQWRLVLFC
ncbi:MFS transporter [Burkholderia sp. Ac-20365]|nr:MFS transporter [Burkholderia sp. Ac-20365]MBN3762314.1 MFS transporter [Burkholderia sp. Ac-20365]